MKISGTALAAPNSLVVMGRKEGSGLSKEQAAALARHLKPFLARYDDNITRMAKAWEISQPQLSQILKGQGRGAGVAVLCRIRKHSNMSIDELLDLPSLPSESPRIQSVIEGVLEDRLEAAFEAAMDRAIEARSTPPLLPSPKPRSRRPKRSEA